MNRPRIKVAAASRRTEDGITFASLKEAKRYLELKLLRRAGEVSWFILQPRFETGGGTKYTADFLIVWSDGRITVEDVKGYQTAAFKRAKKQVEALYPIRIEVV